MAYHVLQTLLGVTFVGVWVFIVVMILHDKLSEARYKRAASALAEPHFPAPKKPRRRSRARRAAV
ncbi:MAG: hypothetical protein KDA37_02760 [Planctomycetales bacterium]|nr:hypothetical protein [Planctomycetales bacterium]